MLTVLDIHLKFNPHVLIMLIILSTSLNFALSGEGKQFTDIKN